MPIGTHATARGLALLVGCFWFGTMWVMGQSPVPSAATYVGSAACGRCHAPTFERWKRTRMANVVRDPREHPEAIVSDFTNPNPLVTFTKDQIALVYGSKFKQRYFKRVGDDFAPFPVTWDVTNRRWVPYGVSGATSGLCDGCHSVNYDIERKTVTEWNVGCERCHGPGGAHVNNPSRANIVNPARLNVVDGVNVCVQCHSQGQPLMQPLEGKYYDWAVGYRPGLKLQDFWQLEEHKLGETTFTHFADGTAHKNRMQGNDFAQSVMYTRGVTCFSCHDVHGTENNADLIKPAQVLCLTCHGPKSPNGPHTATIEQHTHHQAGSKGSDCVGCHMPAIETQLADVNVRSHTFKFISPATTDVLKVPNPCTTCHTDRTTKWALDALKSWPEFSPWRVAN